MDRLSSARLASFASDESGAVATEYAVIGVFVAVGILASLTSVALAVSNVFGAVVALFAN